MADLRGSKLGLNESKPYAKHKGYVEAERSPGKCPLLDASGQCLWLRNAEPRFVASAKSVRGAENVISVVTSDDGVATNSLAHKAFQALLLRVAYTDFEWIRKRHGIANRDKEFKMASEVIGSITSTVKGN